MSDDGEMIAGGETLPGALKRLLLGYLAVEEAKRLNIVPTPEKIKGIERWFRSRYELFTPKQFQDYLNFAKLTYPQFTELMEELFFLAEVENYHAQVTKDKLESYKALWSVREFVIMNHER